MKSAHKIQRRKGLRRPGGSEAKKSSEDSDFAASRWTTSDSDVAKQMRSPLKKKRKRKERKSPVVLQSHLPAPLSHKNTPQAGPKSGKCSFPPAHSGRHPHLPSAGKTCTTTYSDMHYSVYTRTQTRWAAHSFLLLLSSVAANGFESVCAASFALLGCFSTVYPLLLAKFRALCVCLCVVR